MAYHRRYGLDVRIVRIFNTYGPLMRPDDGRVVSNFISQALRGEPLTVYGDGAQTRSFCYATDEVRGFLALLDSDHVGPVNIGNPDEFTMLELANEVLNVDRVVLGAHLCAPAPGRSRPSAGPTSASPRRCSAGEPQVPLREGLERTVPWFADQLRRPTSDGHLHTCCR